MSDQPVISRRRIERVPKYILVVVLAGCFVRNAEAKFVHGTAPDIRNLEDFWKSPPKKKKKIY